MLFTGLILVSQLGAGGWSAQPTTKPPTPPGKAAGMDGQKGASAFDQFVKEARGASDPKTMCANWRSAVAEAEKLPADGGR